MCTSTTFPINQFFAFCKLHNYTIRRESNTQLIVKINIFIDSLFKYLFVGNGTFCRRQSIYKCKTKHCHRFMMKSEAKEFIEEKPISKSIMRLLWCDVVCTFGMYTLDVILTFVIKWISFAYIYRLHHNFSIVTILPISIQPFQNQFFDC